MTNEELIKRLQDFAAGTMLDEDAKLAFEAISALSRDRWISVEERLPESQTAVMVAFDDGEVWCMWQNWKERMDDEPFVYFTEDLMNIHTVTHWRELPQPPKEDKP